MSSSWMYRYHFYYHIIWFKIDSNQTWI